DRVLGRAGCCGDRGRAIQYARHPDVRQEPAVPFVDVSLDTVARDRRGGQRQVQPLERVVLDVLVGHAQATRAVCSLTMVLSTSRSGGMLRRPSMVSTPSTETNSSSLVTRTRNRPSGPYWPGRVMAL